MEKRHCICSGLWFPDSLTANCVPGSREVACKITQCWGGQTLSHTVGDWGGSGKALCAQLTYGVTIQHGSSNALCSLGYRSCAVASPWLLSYKSLDGLGAAAISLLPCHQPPEKAWRRRLMCPYPNVPQHPGEALLKHGQWNNPAAYDQQKCTHLILAGSYIYPQGSLYSISLICF